MKKNLLLMAFAICVMGANAQSTKVITGAVIDEFGNPLPNALVEATGGAESVTTDADGTFTMEVPIWLKSVTAKYAGLPDKKLKLKDNSQLLFEMRPKTSSWFLDFAYSANMAYDDGAYFTRVGLMGGYLGKWGGYLKVMMDVDAECYVPSVTAGVIKSITKNFYGYLGVGFSPVIDHYPDSYSWDTGYYWDYYSGAMIDIGAIYKFKRFNVGLGYSISLDGDCWTNHSIQISLGYCFK